MTVNKETSLAYVKEAVMIENTGRRVVAWASVSMDGYTSGPGGPAHDQGSTTTPGRSSPPLLQGIWRGASTALLGRKTTRVLLRVAGHHPGPAHAGSSP